MTDAAERIKAVIAAAEPLAAASPAPSQPADDPISSHSGGGAGAPPPDDAGDDWLDRALAKLDRTDLANAERFLRRNRGDFLFCPVMGWLAWDGRRWALDQAEGLLAKAVHKTIRKIADEAKAIRNSADDILLDERKGIWLSDKLAGWGLASQGAAHIACIARLAAPYFEIDPARLDADPQVINVLNGTLEARRRGDGEGDYISFRAHDRQDLITKLAGVIYDPQAQCSVYDAFLLKVQPDDGTRRALHQYGGLALTGITHEQIMQFWWGKGKNGKTTLLNIWCEIAGEYSTTLPIESFLDQGRGRRGGEATPDIAMLPGVRMLRTSEPERGAKLAEPMIKLMTGGEEMMARNLNRDPFRFLPRFKAVLSGNYRPEIHGTDDGIWRRVMLVPWLVTIAEAERDRALPDKLKAEASGILNRLLDGLRDYLDRGLCWPAEVREATDSYRTDSDPLGRFLEVCTRPEPESRVQSTVLHAVFNAWAAAAGEKQWTPQGFGRAIRERMKVHKSDVVWVMHIALTKAIADFVDFDGKPLRRDPLRKGEAPP